MLFHTKKTILEDVSPMLAQTYCFTWGHVEVEIDHHNLFNFYLKSHGNHVDFLKPKLAIELGYTNPKAK